MTALDYVMETADGQPRSEKERARRLLESAVREYAHGLTAVGIVPSHVPVDQTVQNLKDMVRYGFLVPCVLSGPEPCILFVPRSTSAQLGGPFDPIALLGGKGLVFEDVEAVRS
ncbi:hypothetical protein LZC95_43195 [Pendulispora brunnea]|uniref:Uncharacterized protein n=1 Tax=Pendulispora brunnea TaxID=2905690 RepID=A0ABZ2K7L3_9BACT